MSSSDSEKPISDPSVPARRTSFFADDAEPRASVLKKMCASARSLFDADDLEDVISDAWFNLEGAVATLFDDYLAGRVPLVALEAACAYSAILRPKSYGVRPIWQAVQAFCYAEEVDDGDDEEDEEIEAFEREIFERELAKIEDEEEREQTRRALMPVKAPKGREILPEEAAFADRYGPLGIGDSSLYDVRKTRPILWHNREVGPVWEGLCAAFDALGGASHAGMERLSKVASKEGVSIAVLWLDEVVCRVTDNEAGAAKRRAELDARLADERFGKNRAKLPPVLRLARRKLGEDRAKVYDAWLKIPSILKAPERAGLLGEDKTPQEAAAIRRAAKEGDGVAKLILDMEEGARRIVEAERREEELAGPFHGMYGVPQEIGMPIEAALHYLLLGYRELLGLEYLVDALPRLEEAVAKMPDGDAK